MNGDNPSSNIRKRIDVDGLTKIPDPVTERMLEKEFNFIVSYHRIIQRFS